MVYVIVWIFSLSIMLACEKGKIHNWCSLVIIAVMTLFSLLRKSMSNALICFGALCLGTAVQAEIRACRTS